MLTLYFRPHALEPSKVSASYFHSVLLRNTPGLSPRDFTMVLIIYNFKTFKFYRSNMIRNK